MPIQYDLREQPGSNDNGKEKLLYPRVVVRRTIKADEFIEKVAHRTTFTTGEVRGIMQLMAETLTENLMEGCSIELEELGFFTPSLTARPVKTKKEIRGSSVRISGVNFLPSKPLKNKLKMATMVRATYGFGKSSQKRTPEQRKALLEEYFKTNSFITRKEYTYLTGLLKDKALADLNGWVKEGWLSSKGSRSTKIFIEKPAEISPEK